MGYQLTGVYIRPNGTEQKIRPTKWTPGANTLVYYDFEHTSGTSETNLAGISNYDGTYQSTPTISTLASGKKVFDSLGNNALDTNSTLSTLDYNNATVCLWFNMPGTNKPFFGQEWRAVQGGTIFCENYNGNTTFALGEWTNNYATTTSTNTWYNVVMTNDGTNMSLYINGQLIGQTAATTSTGDKYFHVGGAAGYTVPSPSAANNLGRAIFGSVIIENEVWTQQKITDYFDGTKDLYGIS